MGQISPNILKLYKLQLILSKMKRGQGIMLAPVPSKKAQMQISFGMIFSIILIIIFIAFAVYGITKFLNLHKEVQVKTFLNEFQSDVDKVWKNEGSDEFEYIIPSNIIKICFKQDGVGENLELRTSKGFFDGAKIEHLNIEKSFCIENTDGKIKIQLERKYGEDLVSVIENE